MQSMSARDAKNSFGKLIDLARAEPVAIEKHGRTVVVVLSIENYKLLQSGKSASRPSVALMPGQRRNPGGSGNDKQDGETK